MLLAVQQTPPPRLSQYARGAPPALEAMLDRCLAKEPETRPASILEAWAGLRTALTSAGNLDIITSTVETPDVYTRTVTAGETSRSAAIGELSATPPASRPLPPPRNGRRWWLAALAVALAAGGAAFLIAGIGRESKDRTIAHGGVIADAATNPGTAPEPDTETETETETEPTTETETETETETGGPVDAAPPPRDAGSSRSSRSRRHHTPAPPPPVDPTPAPPPIRCERPTFAEVYRAASPTPEQVRGALNRLRTCKARGLISENDYTSIQSALVARL